ncbi:Solute carrier family 35 member E2A [Lamellibrachia satsuma]|nr:Solute carrier family 35 member E2A [Lamellibrachia satsuma]
MTAEMSSGHHHMVHSASNGLSLNYDEVDGQTEVKPVPQQGEGHRHVRLGEDKGLFTVKGMSIVWLWYFFSCVTLFLNKHILSTLKCDATILATMQMITTSLFGFINIHFPCGMYKPVRQESSAKPPHFYRNMSLVGLFRFLTVFLGLVSIKFVPVSFTETVKSSAPIFTVVISGALLGEKNGMYVLGSLVPIMAGLALCSAYELRFNMQGFSAALATNLAECLQFVYSKLLISGEKYKSSPAEFQFYTSIASAVIQIPCCLMLVDIVKAQDNMTWTVFLCLIVSGISYHYQTMMAWMLMSFVSPVTHSVTNVVKRALLIWLSVLWFGNPVTVLGALGTITVTCGVLCYNKAREYEHHLAEIAAGKSHCDVDIDEVKHV